MLGSLVLVGSLREGPLANAPAAGDSAREAAVAARDVAWKVAAVLGPLVLEEALAAALAARFARVATKAAARPSVPQQSKFPFFILGVLRPPHPPPTWRPHVCWQHGPSARDLGAMA